MSLLAPDMGHRSLLGISAAVYMALLPGFQDSKPSITEVDLQKRLSQLESKTLNN